MGLRCSPATPGSNEPPSRMNPERLAEEAKKVHSASVSVKVYETTGHVESWARAASEVGGGGAKAPRFVEMIYEPSAKPRKSWRLSVKGITSDSGGLSRSWPPRWKR